MRVAYLTVKSKYIAVSCTVKGRLVNGRITTYDGLIRFLDRHRVNMTLSSSSLDFPKEYTKDRKLIQLCDRIRNC